MDKQQAQEIIKNTFENPFDKVRFTNFIKNLLNRIDESKAFHAHGYVKEGFRGIIKTYQRIGTYNSTDDKKIDIIIVYLQKGFSLDHARVTQRNFAGRYLVERGEKDAGLFAFVSPEESDWRFSLVKMDYKFEQTKSGRMKVKEEFTPARRWSFLVGANEKSHTAQSRLVDILANDEQDPTLKEIEKAFDIETVTKEFFLKYRELFLHTKEELDRVVKKDPKIKADFESKGVDVVNFAKKLLGQIIFLYFLQKKGWFGVPLGENWGDGDKKFLRNLFGRAKKEEKNYFNDYLEPLFYEALRNNRSHEDHYFSMFNCKIPFLNGGLFDPINDYDWKETDIKLPNELFSNKCDDKEGDGVLDIFDLYNFTVKEDEPLEKEVAIDPELLGKSYEKFNAIRQDNFAEFKKALKSGKKGEENKFNKKFGVYYTPREIVHYMCQQSLINYLDTTVNTHKKSITTKPAVQKKIFGPQSPVQQTLTSDLYKPIIPKKDIEKLIHTGEQVSENEAIFLEKEQKIKKGEQKTTSIKTKLPDSIRKNAKLIDDKLAEITVCDPAVGSGAFPVGMMSEIVKIRNVLTPFLSLRGAQATCLRAGTHRQAKQSQFDDNRTVYNFKRQCIEHSLYGVDIDPGAVEIAKLRLWLSLVVDEDDIKNIKPLPNLDYRIMQGNSLISEFIGINFDDNENKNLKKEIEELNAEIKALQKEKSDKESKSSRHYKKTIEIDQNLLNEINVLDDKIIKLKKKRTQLNKKLNHQEESPEIINLISEFQKKKNTFLNESNVSRKSKLKEEVNDLLIKVFEAKLQKQKADYFNRFKNIENKYSVLRNEKQRDELIKQDKEKLNKESGFDLEASEKQLKEFTSGKRIKPFFLWNLYFSEVFLSGAKSALGGQNKGGFDVVIANPPYVKESTNKSAFDELRNSECYQGKMDLWYLFGCNGLNILKQHGIMCFIATNNWISNDGASKFRNKVIKNGRLINFIDFGNYKVFTAGIQTMVYLMAKDCEPSQYQLSYGKLLDDNADLPMISNFLSSKTEISTTNFKKYPVVLNRKSFVDTYIKFIHPVANGVLDRIKKVETFHLADDEVFSGIDVMQDFVSKASVEKLGGKFDAGTGVFVISNKEKTGRPWNRKELEIIKPYYTTREINRYYANPRNKLWVLYTGTQINRSIKSYPNIKKHLDQFKNIITSVNKPYGLHRTREEQIFLGDKILSVRKCSQPSFAYVDFPCYVARAFLILKSNRINLKFLLSILNSKLIAFWLYEKGKLQGNLYQIDKVPIQAIPVKIGRKEEQNRLIELVDKILAITKDEDYLQSTQKQAQVKALEHEIDQMVYKLYGLTNEEIKIVENS